MRILSNISAWLGRKKSKRAGISKLSYYKSVSLHICFFLFIVMPLAVFVPEYLDSGTVKSEGTVKLITLSEDDYKKITRQTTGTTAAPSAAMPAKQATQEAIRIAKKDPPKPKMSPINRPKENKKDPKPDTAIAKQRPDKNKTNAMETKTEHRLESQHSEEEAPEEIERPQQTIFGDAADVVSSTEEGTISIKDIIAVQLNRCWSEYHDANFATKNMVVTAVIGYDQNGAVNKIDFEKKGFLDPKKAALYQIMTENAKRSITDCSPLKGLPASMYGDWHHIKINFKYGKIEG